MHAFNRDLPLDCRDYCKKCRKEHNLNLRNLSSIKYQVLHNFKFAVLDYLSTKGNPGDTVKTPPRTAFEQDSGETVQVLSRNLYKTALSEK